MKLSRRRFEKRKARERRVRERQQESVRRQQYREQFPKFVLVNEAEADHGFVRQVQRAIKQVNFRDESVFHPSETKMVEYTKTFGPNVIAQLAKSYGETSSEFVYMMTHLGQVVFDIIGQQELRKWIPYNDVQLLVGGRTIRVYFRSISRQKGRLGTIYHSRHRPTITVDGHTVIVGFSRHAIERICERVVPRWYTYNGLGSVFAFLDQCQSFERADLSDGQLAFTFYDNCRKGFFSGNYVRQILRQEEEVDRYCYRVGYCPAVIEGGYLRATTLLYPGYKPTPEWSALWQSGLSVEEKRRLVQQTKLLSTEYLQNTGDFSLLRFFHEQGIVQVRPIQGRLFKGAFESDVKAGSKHCKACAG